MSSSGTTLPASRYSRFHAFITDPGLPQLDALPPRAHFWTGPAPEDPLKADVLGAESSPWTLKLDGKWRFFYSPELLSVPEGFEDEEYVEGTSNLETALRESDASYAATAAAPRAWADLSVPSCWQMPSISGEGGKAMWARSGASAVSGDFSAHSFTRLILDTASHGTPMSSIHSQSTLRIFLRRTQRAATCRTLTCRQLGLRPLATIPG